jgi:hypothetical protein
MNKIMIAVAALAIGACVIPSEEDIERQFGDAVEECRGFVEDATIDAEERAWGICTEYYETQVIPDVEGLLQEQIEDLQQWFEQQMDDLVFETMLNFGCIMTEPADGVTWDCSESFICGGF